MRKWMVLGALMLGSAGWCGPGLPLRALVQGLREAGALPPPIQQRPTEATGFPANDPGQRQMTDINSALFILRRADSTRRSGNIIYATGNVQFSYKGYEVQADKATGNLETEVFVLEGNVAAQSKGQEFRGQRVILDYKNRSASYELGTSRLEPEVLGNALRGPLFIKTESGEGTESQGFSRNSKFTTCSYPEPHYEFDARESDLQPYKRLILRGVGFNLLGRRILNLPYVYIPLNRRADRYTPEVGQSRDEGYYIKNRTNVALRGNDVLGIRTDYFSKLGAGLGGDWLYDRPGLTGLARAYVLPGRTKSQLYSLDHQQRAFGGTFRVEGNWIKNNYLTAPNNRSYNIRSAFLRKTGDGNLRLSATRNGNRSSSFQTVNQTVSLQHDQAWNNRFRTNFNLDTSTQRSSSGFGAPTERKVATVNLRATQEFRQAQAQFEYFRTIPIGSQQGFFSSSDRTPVLTLTSDSRRLLGSREPRWLPLNIEASWGELVDAVKRNQISRASLDLRSQKSFTLPRGSSFTYSSRFRQGIYSNDSAQYALASNFAYRHALGEKSSATVRYNYQEAFGFTPLSIDRINDTDEAALDMALQIHRTFSVSASTAYDRIQLRRKITPWQGVAIRTEWNPNDKLLLRTSANYDTFNQVWSNVRLDAGWRVSKGFVSLGARYDGPRHTLGNVNLYADGLEWGKLRTSVALSYNGYSKKFESRQISLTYDLHCWEAILQVIDQPVGFRSGREIAFFIRIKALPFDTPFGIGRRGQAIGSGTGFNP